MLERALIFKSEVFYATSRACSSFLSHTVAHLGFRPIPSLYTVNKETRDCIFFFSHP